MLLFFIERLSTATLRSESRHQVDGALGDVDLQPIS
jgi:hypothetical protein